MTANPLFWKIGLEIKSDGVALLGEGGRQKLREKLADYTREFVLRRQGINAAGDAAGDLAGAGTELLDVEGEADHATKEITKPGAEAS